jgi:hypothetical protein
MEIGFGKNQNSRDYLGNAKSKSGHFDKKHELNFKKKEMKKVRKIIVKRSQFLKTNLLF